MSRALSSSCPRSISTHASSASRSSTGRASGTSGTLGEVDVEVDGAEGLVRDEWRDERNADAMRLLTLRLGDEPDEAALDGARGPPSVEDEACRRLEAPAPPSGTRCAAEVLVPLEPPRRIAAEGAPSMSGTSAMRTVRACSASSRCAVASGSGVGVRANREAMGSEAVEVEALGWACACGWAPSSGEKPKRGDGVSEGEGASVWRSLLA